MAVFDWSFDLILIPDVLLDLRMLFDKQDADNSGCIDKGEVGKMISDLGFKMSGSELDQYFNHMDTDGSGVVGFKEFCTAVLECAAMERSRFQDRVGHTAGIDAGHSEGQVGDLEFFSKTFSFFDLDNSGYIDATEMHARLEGYYPTTSLLLDILAHARPATDQSTFRLGVGKDSTTKRLAKSLIACCWFL